MRGLYEVWGTDIPEENRMLVEIWEFRKRFYRVENTPEYFDAVRREAERIYAAHQNRLCHDLLWAVMEDFERRGKHEGS